MRRRLNTLVDYSIRLYYPELQNLEGAARVGAFLKKVCEKTGEMVGSWMLAGFVHGVFEYRQHEHHRGELRLRPLSHGAIITILISLRPTLIKRAFIRSFGKSKRGSGTFNSWRERSYPYAIRRRSLKRCNLTPRSYLSYVGGAPFVHRLGVRSQGPQMDRGLSIGILNFMRETDTPFEQLYFDWYGGGSSEARADEEPCGALLSSAEFSACSEFSANL